MANAGQVRVDFTANIRQFNRAITSATRRLDSFGRDSERSQSSVSRSTIAMGNAYAMMAQVATKALTKIITSTKEVVKESVNMAMALESSLNRSSRMYGDAAQDVEDFSKRQARAFNISEEQAVRYSNAFGNTIKNMGISKKEAAALSQELIKLAGVIKSQESRFTMEQILDKLRSGLVLETRAIDNLGIEVRQAMLMQTDAFKKFAGDKSWNELDFNVRQAITTFAILEQGFKSFGDEMQDTTMNDLQKLNVILDDTKLRLGEAFLPLVEVAVPYLITFAETLEVVAKAVKTFSEMMSFETGKEIEGTTFTVKKATKAQEDLGKGIKKTKDEIKRSVGTFDEFNFINESIKKSTEGAATQLDLSGLINFKPKTKTGLRPADIFEDGIFEQELIDTFDFYTDPENWKTFWEEVKSVATDTLDRMGLFFSTEKKMIGDFVTFVSDAFGEFTDKENWEWFWKGVDGIAADAFRAVGIDVKDGTGQDVNISDVFSGYLNLENWKFFWEGVKDIATESFLGQTWTDISDGFSEFFTGIWEDSEEKTEDGMDTIKKRTDQSITDITDLSWDNISKTVEEMWKKTRKKTNDWWYSIKERVKKTMEELAGKGKGFLDWDSIKKRIGLMWLQVKGRTGEMWFGIKATVVDAINFIIRKINELIRKWNGLSFQVPDILGGGTITPPQVNTLQEIPRPVQNTELLSSEIPAQAPQQRRELDTSSLPSTPLSDAALGLNREFKAVMQIDGKDIGTAVAPYVQEEIEKRGGELGSTEFFVR